MTETLQSNGQWHYSLVISDLASQGGIKRTDLEFDIGHIKYKGRRVFVSHIAGDHLVVSLEGKDNKAQAKLISAFSKIVEYQPFCRYTLHIKDNPNVPPLPTFEWDKINPKKRLASLKLKNNITELVRINNRKKPLPGRMVSKC